MVETTLSMIVIFLLGCVIILIKGGWDMHIKIDKLEDFTSILMEFTEELGGLSKDETNKKFDQFINRKRREHRGKHHE